jgi:hypothetical protein
LVYHFCETLIDKIEEEKQVIATAIINGSFDTLERYKHACGKINGLDIAITKVKELLKDSDNI